MKMPKVPKFLKSVRYMLAGVNSLFLITGFLLLIVGIIALVRYVEYEHFITRRFFSFAGFIIATGVIILLTSLLGYYGAVSEKFYFIIAYVTLLFVILIFDGSIVIVGFRIYSDAASEIRNSMSQSRINYATSISVARLWDNLQMDFECCGVGGPADWGMNQRIPISCCLINPGTISPFTCDQTNARSTGCAQSLGAWLGYNAYVAAIVASTVTGLQVIILVIAGWSAWRSKFEEVELES